MTTTTESTVRTPAPDGPTPAGRNRRRGERDAWLLVLPALIPVLVLSVVPLVRGVYLGFTDSRAGLGVPTHFTGIANYRELWHDSLFLDSFRIGLIWALSVAVIQFGLALGLALRSTRICGCAGWPAPWPWCRGQCRRSSSRSCGGCCSAPPWGRSTRASER